MRIIKDQDYQVLTDDYSFAKKKNADISVIQSNIMYDMYKRIEEAGKNCYQANNNITEDSAKPFIERLISSKHYAPLEFGTVYLTIDKANRILDFYSHKYKENSYSIVAEECGDGNLYITTNYRVIIENGWEDDLQYLTEPKEGHERRICVKLGVTNRQIMSEITRHRPMSFCIESTRFINYGKEKFDGELVFVRPWWSSIKIQENNSNEFYTATNKNDGIILQAFKQIEDCYKTLVANGLKAQEAAQILCNATKCTIYMCGFVKDWKHVFDLRSDIALTGKPHPQMSEIMTPIREEFKTLGYLI